VNNDEKLIKVLEEIRREIARIPSAIAGISFMLFIIFLLRGCK
jgi:hypothetical protein